jgi:hypothetical protein
MVLEILIRCSSGLWDIVDVPAAIIICLLLNLWSLKWMFCLLVFCIFIELLLDLMLHYRYWAIVQSSLLLNYSLHLTVWYPYTLILLLVNKRASIAQSAASRTMKELARVTLRPSILESASIRLLMSSLVVFINCWSLRLCRVILVVLLIKNSLLLAVLERWLKLLDVRLDRAVVAP